MSGWNALQAELDAWRRDGRTATFWWRDDDARDDTPALARLLEIAAAQRAPVAVAVVPADMEDRLADVLVAAAGVSVLQHGYAHQNHAGPKEKKMELGPHRPFEQVIAEIATGWQRLDSAFSAPDARDRLLPVMVPPWNRIDPRLVPMLPELRYTGLSAFGPRPRRAAVAGLCQVNSHIDIMRWQAPRGFAGSDAALEAATRHLAARRAGAVDMDEPTGLLTHHLAHDEAAWGFVAEFVTRVADHPASRWLSAGEAFASGGT